MRAPVVVVVVVVVVVFAIALVVYSTRMLVSCELRIVLTQQAIA
jgi:hypothetical protein